MDKLSEILEKIREQRVHYENEEMIKFLSTRNLPTDKDALKELGYEVFVEYNQEEILDLKEKVVFKLLKIVDKVEMQFNYNITTK